MMYALFRSTNDCGSRIHNRSIITILYILFLLITPCVIGETSQENNDKCEHSSFRMLYYKDQLNYVGAIHDIFFYGPGRCPFCDRQISLGTGRPTEIKSKIYRNIKGKVDIIDIPSAPIVAVCEPQGNSLFIVTVKGPGKIYDNNPFEWIKQFEQKDGLLVQMASFSRSGRYIVMCLVALGLEKDEHNQNIVYAYDIDNMTGEKYSFGTKTPISLIYVDEDTAVITTEEKYVYVDRDINQDISFRVEERKEDQGIIVGCHKRELIYLQQSVNIDGIDQVELISPIFKEGKILFNEDYMYVLSGKDNLWLRGVSGKIYKMDKDGLPDLITTIEKDIVSWGLFDAGGIWINTDDKGIITILSDLCLNGVNCEPTNIN